MSCHSDPTASRALGNINRDFEKHEKKARTICRLYLQKKLSQQEWDNAHSLFKGIYRHVLDNMLEKILEEQEKQETKKTKK